MGFVLNSILLGVGLAMDAFSVSVANGLAEPSMRARKRLLIAGAFAFFQALMPMIGYFFVHSLVEVFSALDRAVPYIAFALLGYIGVKMIISGARAKPGDEKPALNLGALLVQAVATSIDALSVGLTMADYTLLSALASALIIAAVTFAICIFGVTFGAKIGERISGKAEILGGAILVFIGLEIFIKAMIK
ncbi:MAG: manganese efflux pump [Clostridia bacterium]|nr:manganese efflux pump [Clostridia bacterium]